ncbi:protein Tex1p [Monosporozyma unispora]|nr:hypothetical protein C6P44_000112 [Kazachstania unispora]
MTFEISDFLEKKEITPDLADFITESYLKELLNNGKSGQKIEDDRFTQVASRTNSRFGSSLTPNEVLSMEFHPSGKLLAYSRMDGSLTIWEVPDSGDFNSSSSRKIITNNVVGKEKLVTDLSWNGIERSQIATATNSNELIIWSLDDAKSDESEVHRIKTLHVGSPRTKINKCYYSPRGKWLLAATKSENLYLLSPENDFSIESTIKLKEYISNNDSIYSFTWNNSDDYFFVGCKDGKILGFTVEEAGGKETNVSYLFSLEGHRGSVTTLKMDQYGRYLISGSSDGTCVLWDLNTFISKHTITDINSLILSIDVDHLSKIMAISTADDTLLFYNTSDGTFIDKIEIEDLKADIWFKFHPNKTWFIKSSKDDILLNHTNSATDEMKFWRKTYESALSSIKNKGGKGNDATSRDSSRASDSRNRRNDDRGRRPPERSNPAANKIRKNFTGGRSQKRFGGRYDNMDRDRSSAPSRPSMPSRFNR